jgi:type II secretory pathway component PulF
MDAQTLPRAEELRRFTLWLAWLLGSGVPVADALELISTRAAGEVHQMARALADGVASSQPLAEALDSCPEFFPRAYRDTVAIGEWAGMLHLAFADLAARS